LAIAEVFLGDFEEDFEALEDLDFFDFLAPSGGAEDEAVGGAWTEMLDSVVLRGFSEEMTLLPPPLERKGCDSICWVRDDSSVAFL